VAEASGGLPYTLTHHHHCCSYCLLPACTLVQLVLKAWLHPAATAAAAAAAATMTPAAVKASMTSQLQQRPGWLRLLLSLGLC